MPPTIITGKKNIGICYNVHLGTSSQEIQKKPVRRLYFQWVLRTYKSSPIGSGHDHTCNVYIRPRLDYPIRDIKVCVNRQLLTVQQQVLRNAMPKSHHEAIHDNRLSSTNQYTGKTIQRKTYDVPSPLCHRLPTRLAHTRSAVDLCIK